MVCGPGPVGSHTYFNNLVARSDMIANYSLRSQAQIDQFSGGDGNSFVTYGPSADSDPRRQDAAKIVIPASTNSLPAQVWLPTNHSPRQNLFATWDAWYGAELVFSSAKIGGWKAWNLCSPSSGIYTEVQTLFDFGAQVPGGLCFTCIRQYDGRGPNTFLGPVLNGRNYGGTTIGPMANEFLVRPEVWTRYWLYMRDDTDWYRMNLWVADENQNPVQVYSDLQVRPREAGVGVSMNGRWGILRIELNTSQSISQHAFPLICYARNVVFLGGTSASAAASLLQRPSP